jgi:leucyl aminopeptidase
MLQLKFTHDSSATSTQLILISKKDLEKVDISFTSKEKTFIQKQFSEGVKIAELITPAIIVLVVLIPEKAENLLESIRRLGVTIVTRLRDLKIKDATLVSQCSNEEVIALAEGIALANYQFLKYKKSEKTIIETIYVASVNVSKLDLDEFNEILTSVYIARDLVNEPVIFLTAEQLSKEIENLGNECGFSVEVFSKSKIQSLKMGGLLAVNAGSPNPPTFNILEYKPSKNLPRLGNR